MRTACTGLWCDKTVAVAVRGRSSGGLRTILVVLGAQSLETHPATLCLPYPSIRPTTATVQHEARVQKAAEGKLEAARGGSLAASGSASGAGEKKAEAPLLFDLIYNGEPALCIKVGGVGVNALCSGCEGQVQQATGLCGRAASANQTHHPHPPFPTQLPLQPGQAKRDTRNPTVLSKERRPGPWKTHASLTHTAPPAGG